MYRLSIALFSLFGIVQLYAQPGLRPGGLAGDTLIMVSAGKGHFSRSLADMAIAGVELRGKELSFRPQLQGHEHFMAVCITIDGFTSSLSTKFRGQGVLSSICTGKLLNG